MKEFLIGMWGYSSVVVVVVVVVVSRASVNALRSEDAVPREAHEPGADVTITVILILDLISCTPPSLDSYLWFNSFSFIFMYIVIHMHML